MTASRLPFELIRDPAAMRAKVEDLRRDGRTIAVVPTMGYLHEGHLSLLRAARARADVVVLTIFVNPTQFGPTEDLARYPRDEDGDLAKARGCGVDLAFFGEKDFQQLAIIRRLVRDLDFGIEVVGLPIVREPDGLAMSSRNVYLAPDHRRQALALSRGLAAAAAAVAAGERDAAALLAAARAPFTEAPDARLDYLELRGADDLAPVTRLDRRAVMAVAAFVGTTRLIDNRVLTP